MTIKRNPSNIWLKLVILVPIYLYSELLSSQQFSYAELKDCKKFKSIEDGLKNPDSVFVLNLSKNKLREIPKEISLFKNLHILNLSKNKLSSIDSTIYFPKNILEVNLSKNLLETIPEAILSIKSLQRLILNQNDITSIPENIAQLENLVYLDLWSNNISYVSDNIKYLKRLDEMDLRVILFSAEEKERIKQLLPNANVFFSKSCNCGY